MIGSKLTLFLGLVIGIDSLHTFVSALACQKTITDLHDIIALVTLACYLCWHAGEGGQGAKKKVWSSRIAYEYGNELRGGSGEIYVSNVDDNMEQSWGKSFEACLTALLTAHSF